MSPAFHELSDPNLLHAWTLGVEEFNRGRDWHAHEGWEHGWTRLPEPTRTRVQSLIQVASVFHLLGLGREHPALTLAASALAKLERVGPMTDVLPRLEIPGAEAALRGLLCPGGLAGWRALRASLKAELLLPPAV